MDSAKAIILRQSLPARTFVFSVKLKSCAHKAEKILPSYQIEEQLANDFANFFMALRTVRRYI